MSYYWSVISFIFQVGPLSSTLTYDGEYIEPVKLSGRCHFNNSFIGEIINLESPHWSIVQKYERF